MTIQIYWKFYHTHTHKKKKKKKKKKRKISDKNSDIFPIFPISAQNIYVFWAEKRKLKYIPENPVLLYKSGV